MPSAQGSFGATAQAVQKAVNRFDLCWKARKFSSSAAQDSTKLGHELKTANYMLQLRAQELSELLDKQSYEDLLVAGFDERAARDLADLIAARTADAPRPDGSLIALVLVLGAMGLDTAPKVSARPGQSPSVDAPAGPPAGSRRSSNW